MKNYLIGIILLVLAFVLLWREGGRQVDLAKQDANRSVSSVSPIDGNNSPGDQNLTISAPVSSGDGNASAVLGALR